MIIGIDYTAAAWQGAGIGRYTRELVRAAAAMGGPFQYVLFYAAGGSIDTSPYRTEIRQLCTIFPHIRSVPLPFSPRLLTILWQRLRLPLRVEYFTGPLDIVHAPDFVLPPTGSRSLLTVHDLTFLVHPKCFEPALATYLARVVPRSLQRAHLVLTDSVATRNDLTRLLNIPAERSVVLYPGVSPRFHPLPSVLLEPVRQRLHLPESFLLFVGTLEPRKNLVRLLHAFKGIMSTDADVCSNLHLVIAGRKGWLYEDIFRSVDQLNLESRVRFLDFVEDKDLPALYNLARVLVYPSLYEGFGLPVAEAMACGTPVVTTQVASVPEIVGRAGILVNPNDSDALASGMMQALQDPAPLRAAGPKQVRRFVWEQSARTLLACYMRVREERL